MLRQIADEITKEWGRIKNIDKTEEKTINQKKKMGSNRMEPKLLTPSCNNHNNQEYLNVLINPKDSHAGMAEWLTQLVNTKCPFGFVGSIPTLGVANFKF